jgi:flagellar motor component MotA
MANLPHVTALGKTSSMRLNIKSIIMKVVFNGQKNSNGRSCEMNLTKFFKLENKIEQL